ncbi:flavin reductase family protein [Streptomyces sp. NPDC004783]|uniref:flavin reductase family protein n=1 Tax=Streptomyces sp. NPDC004783 TaxID=3154459 RepID=UPI0033B4D4CB
MTTLTQRLRAPDKLAMRRTMGHFVTGVAVVTTLEGDTPQGMTVNSLTSISLEPPILMVSLNHGSRTGDAIESCGTFGVSILSARQEQVARVFSRPGQDHFAGGHFDVTENGIHLIKDSLAQAECTVHQAITVGDHRVIFGEVTGAWDRQGPALAFDTGHFGEFFGFGHDPMPWTF